MGDKSPIEWLRGADGDQGATWNPIRARNLATGGIGHFCIHKSEACRHCYAERLQVRFRNAIRYAAQDREKVELFLDWETLLLPFRWKRARLIFVLSMTDLFLEHHCDRWIDPVLCAAALNPQHTFIALTKRPERMRAYFGRGVSRLNLINGQKWSLLGTPTGSKIHHGGQWMSPCLPLPNVWGLVSISEQKDADEFVPELLATPLAVRGVSAEPLLGPIDLLNFPSWSSMHEGLGFTVDALTGTWKDGTLRLVSTAPHLDWVIVGGESGPKARPMLPDWARSLRDQCKAAAVPFFLKQWGEFGPCDLRGFGDDMRRWGKKAAGRLLDGVEHNEFPQVSS